MPQLLLDLIIILAAAAFVAPYEQHAATATITADADAGAGAGAGANRRAARWARLRNPES